MKKQNYFPRRLSEQADWLDNFALKLGNHAAALALTPTQVTNGSARAAWGNYVLSRWLTAVRNFGPSTTEAVDLVLYGTGTTPVELPTFDPPDLPDGVAAQLPGILLEIFELVAVIKLSKGYTLVIGQDLGIEGSEDTAQAVSPRVTLKLEQGAGCQCVRATFTKDGHMGVYGESRIGDGEWGFLCIDTESPYLDERPLKVAGVPEVREYRFRYWDKGTPNGEWTAVQKVTVSP